MKKPKQLKITVMRRLTRLLMEAAILAGIALLPSCGGNKSPKDGQIPANDTIIFTGMTDTARPVASIIDSANMNIPLESASDSTIIDTKGHTSPSVNGELNIKINPGKMKFKDIEGAEAFYGLMTLTLTNLSDTPIAGKDYYISYKAKAYDGTSDDAEEYVVTLKAKGINLGSGESGKITLKRQDANKLYDFKIKRK